MNISMCFFSIFSDFVWIGGFENLPKIQSVSEDVKIILGINATKHVYF